MIIICLTLYSKLIIIYSNLKQKYPERTIFIMMKWKARKETINIGTMELGNVTLDEDNIGVFVDICDMSDSLKAEVNKAIEI